MAQGVRDPAVGSHNLSPKQRGKKRREASLGRAQCLTWINVCLSALGRFWAWRSASSHSFLTWDRGTGWTPMQCKVVLINLCFESAEKRELVQKRRFPKTFEQWWEWIKKSLPCTESNKAALCACSVRLKMIKKKKVWQYGENVSAVCECYCTARRKSDYKLHHVSSSNPHFRNLGLCLYPRLLLNEEHQIIRSDTLPRWKVSLQQFEREVNQTPCVSRADERGEESAFEAPETVAV